MMDSPLKKKQYTLNSSRDHRMSLESSSKSPFRIDYMQKCTQLEQELYRVTQQRKLLTIELEELQRQYVKKSQILSSVEADNAQLVQQFKQSDEVNRLNQLLKQELTYIRQKNLVIQEWTNRYMVLEEKVESDLCYQDILKSQQMQTDIYKEQVQEYRLQVKSLQDNYKMMRDEKNRLQKQLMSMQVVQQDKNYSSKCKQLEQEKVQLSQQLTASQQEINLLKEQMSIHTEKKDKWKSRCKQSKQSSSEPEEDVNDLLDKIHQLESENTYLRDQNMQMQNENQGLTDKLLKLQLSQSIAKEGQQMFSFHKEQ